MEQRRLVISGLSGGSGKTLASIGLSRLLSSRGLAVQACKKGPDYIDSAWLALATGRPAACLDPYFLSDDGLLGHFIRSCAGSQADIALIEGNRGLFDGRDVQGSCSTAHVARVLSAPVLITLNCAKMTRTAAAVIAGLAAFEPGLRLGVLLNNTAGQRHATMLRRCVEEYTDVPVLGILPRMGANPLPERHLGLTMPGAAREREAMIEKLSGMIADNCDVPAILGFAGSAPPLPDLPAVSGPAPHEGARPVIGYVRDDALWFYYQENLDALTAAGARLVQLSLLDEHPWPALDGLYLGGGYPELFAREISASPHLADIRSLSLACRPIYAECGGMMILSRSLRLDSGTFPMAGLLPLSVQFCPSPQGLGYVSVRTTAPNPFHPAGSAWRGHEFHYSRCIWTGRLPDCCLDVLSGKGMYEKDGRRFDGLLQRSTFACWTHLFAPAVPHWAPNFVKAATRDRR
ncbi:MAG: cobyrinate a,c-diamide synthase [Desulfovibrio sp.]|jgi:cobyrinic acid a,c-diamide synthase|nr:cobyrinate a,c-diamide synthase [Mailhella sp.]